MKKIYIWGTGKSADCFLNIFSGCFDHCGYIESAPESKNRGGVQVYSIEEIKSLEYDLILIVNAHSAEIYSDCAKRGIALDRIVDIYNKKIGIIDAGKFELDFSGSDCKEGWIT